MNTDDINNTNGNDTNISADNEEHIMAAFTDLRHRAGAVAVDNGPHVQAVGGTRNSNTESGSDTKGHGRRFGFGNSTGPGGSDNRLIPALAFVVLAAVAGFSAWQLLPDGDTADSVNVTADGDLADDNDTNGNDDTDGDDNVTTDDGTGQDTTDSTDTTVDGSDGASGPVEAGDRFRVDTSKVAADTSDPFLNIRMAPGAGSKLVAKLPPTYRGMVATDTAATITDDGATWRFVQLVDPVNVNLGEPLHGGFPAGWVNTNFILPLGENIAVDTAEVPACTSPADETDAFGRLGGTGYVYGLESARIGPAGDCLRVVVTIGQGSAPFLWDDVPTGTGPAAALPDAFVAESGGGGVVLNLGDVDSAWIGAQDTDDGVYVVRGDDGNVDLVSPVPVGRIHLTPLPADGIIVLDMETAGDPPQAERFVALTDEPRVSAGSVTVVGVARPFEANLGVSIVDADGSPTAALYSGSASLGTRRSTEYGVQTNDWTEAWGRFAVTASGLAPGSYTMLLDGEGGVDNPTLTAVPFTITEAPTDDTDEPTEDEQAAAQALVRFAQGSGTWDDLNLADRVTLSLGVTHTKAVTGIGLQDRDNWAIDFEPFAGRTGPFNLLDVLGDGQVRFSAGTIPHCASPALDWPDEWAGYTQVNIEPVDATSCLEWYAVSLFRNDDGDVEAIALDLFEP